MITLFRCQTGGQRARESGVACRATDKFSKEPFRTECSHSWFWKRTPVFARSCGSKVRNSCRRSQIEWDQLKLGGQHMEPTEPLLPGIVRSLNYHKRHVRQPRKFHRELYRRWCSSSAHCDHIMGRLQSGYRVYAPDSFLVGQAQGLSDSKRWQEPRQILVPPPTDLPIVRVHVPWMDIVVLRSRGLPTG